MTIRILIVDDHGVLRAGLRALLNAEDGFEVVGEAASGEQALEQVERLQPRVVLMDISMPGISGIEVTRRLAKKYPGIFILLLTLHEDTGLLREAMQAGASGFILKKAVDYELIEAIRQVSEGRMYIHPAMTRALMDEKPPARKDKDITLTQREVDVLRLLARGFTNRQIAEELALSTRTVETHRANLMAKLDLHSRVELMRYAAEHGLA